MKNHEIECYGNCDTSSEIPWDQLILLLYNIYELAVFTNYFFKNSSKTINIPHTVWKYEKFTATQIFFVKSIYCKVL